MSFCGKVSQEFQDAQLFRFVVVVVDMVGFLSNHGLVNKFKRGANTTFCPERKYLYL